MEGKKEGAGGGEGRKGGRGLVCWNTFWAEAIDNAEEENEEEENRSRSLMGRK